MVTTPGMDMATAADSASVWVGVAGASVGAAVGTTRTTAVTGDGDRRTTVVGTGALMRIAVGAGVVTVAMATVIIREL